MEFSLFRILVDRPIGGTIAPLTTLQVRALSMYIIHTVSSKMRFLNVYRVDHCWIFFSFNAVCVSMLTDLFSQKPIYAAEITIRQKSISVFLLFSLH